MALVLPKTYLVGYTTLNLAGLATYLHDTDQKEFSRDIEEALASGLDPGEILCSFYAKSCYASLTDKKNKNISRTRSIADNIAGILDSGHGSVIEHCWINFMTTNCSRVFTHELVRHRAGTAFSQTSGRYVRTDKLDVVIDPILSHANDLIEECRDYLEKWYKRLEERMNIDKAKDFNTKKKLTSAMRRMLPNGQANEMGFSVNLRALRHTIETRTSRHADWEIRLVFNQIYDLVSSRYPIMFHDAKSVECDGAKEITFRNKKV
jgi:thymidylate synthase (FAD)